MANIFDIPTKQTYVDTYVPLPFQAIAAVGDKIQKQNEVVYKFETYKNLLTQLELRPKISLIIFSLLY